LRRPIEQRLNRHQQPGGEGRAQTLAPNRLIAERLPDSIFLHDSLPGAAPASHLLRA
jgi:hypothetical protein